jgi:hypothetical protein
VHRHIEAELHGTTKEFEQLLAQDLPALNESLKAKGQQPIEPPPTKVGANDYGLRITSPGDNAHVGEEFEVSGTYKKETARRHSNSQFHF